MPLRAVSDTGNIHAFEFDATRWAELKRGYSSMGLHIPCCGAPAIPKTSTRGNFFFAHARIGECTTAPESAEHLYCKQLVAQAAQSAGWTVTTERPGVSPSGEEWIADVFCEKGTAKIALEIQISPQSDEEAARRQLRYKASGVRGAWFYGAKARKGTVVFDKSTPAFGLGPVEVGKAPMVRRFEVSLTEFVAALLGKRLVWTVPEYSRPIQVEFFPDTCWACKKPNKQVFGYFEGEVEADDQYGFHERAFTGASMSTALEELQEVVSNEELITAGLNPIGQQDVIHGKPTKWPHCNLCLHCRAPQNNFHLGEKLRVDLYGLTPVSDDADFEQWDEDRSRTQLNDLAPIPRVVKGGGYWELKPPAVLPTPPPKSP